MDREQKHLKEKGNLSVDTVPLKPMRDMVEIKGKYDEIMLRDFYKNTTLQEDYVHITLTDEDDIPDAIGKLRTVYRNLMKLDYDNLRTRAVGGVNTGTSGEKQTPFELFSSFFEKQNDRPLNEEQQIYIKGLFEKLGEKERRK